MLRRIFDWLVLHCRCQTVTLILRNSTFHTEQPKLDHLLQRKSNQGERTYPNQPCNGGGAETTTPTPSSPVQGLGLLQAARDSSSQPVFAHCRAEGKGRGSLTPFFRKPGCLRIQRKASPSSCHMLKAGWQEGVKYASWVSECCPCCPEVVVGAKEPWGRSLQELYATAPSYKRSLQSPRCQVVSPHLQLKTTLLFPSSYPSSMCIISLLIYMITASSWTLLQRYGPAKLC